MVPLQVMISGNDSSIQSSRARPLYLLVAACILPYIFSVAQHTRALPPFKKKKIVICQVQHAEARSSAAAGVLTMQCACEAWLVLWLPSAAATTQQAVGSTDTAYLCSCRHRTRKRSQQTALKQLPVKVETQQTGGVWVQVHHARHKGAHIRSRR